MTCVLYNGNLEVHVAEYVFPTYYGGFAYKRKSGVILAYVWKVYLFLSMMGKCIATVDILFWIDVLSTSSYLVW